jgi:hypothetical protein
MRSKRSQAASRRSEHEDVSGAYSTKEQMQSVVEEEASSGEDDGQERRGRTKIERWNSRKEREVIPTVAVDEKRHRRSHAREVDVLSEPPSADQHVSEKRQVRYHVGCLSDC